MWTPVQRRLCSTDSVSITRVCRQGHVSGQESRQGSLSRWHRAPVCCPCHGRTFKADILLLLAVVWLHVTTFYVLIFRDVASIPSRQGVSGWQCHDWISGVLLGNLLVAFVVDAVSSRCVTLLFSMDEILGLHEFERSSYVHVDRLLLFTGIRRVFQRAV